MIIYFSGTGNSRYAAQRLAELTGDEALDLFDRIKNSDFSPLQSEKPWVLTAPVYAWKIPGIVEEYLKKTALEGSDEIYYVLTCGDGVAGAGIYAQELSMQLGKTYKGLAPVVMPENYIAMFPVPDRNESLQIIEAAEDTISMLADRISEGKDFNAKAGSRFMSSIINRIFFGFIVKDRKFTAGENCNGCGLCAKVCPLNNVRIEGGRPKWQGNCTHCMRCICMCPQEAIEYGKASRGKWRYLCPASAEQQKLTFAKAGAGDIPAIAEIYDRIHTLEETGSVSIGWNRKIYPTAETAREAIAAGDMYIAKCGGEIVASARINKEQVHPTYDEVKWKYEAEPEEVMVIHTLVVDPERGREGIGRDFVKFYEDLAAAEGCKVLRLDTNERNLRARAMYSSLGYQETEIRPCTFNGIKGVDLVCLEKKI